MGVKVYYSEISAQKEVKKRQQKVMMILESKLIKYEAIDITEPGKETEKDFMLTTAKPRGDSKCVVSPQIFNEDQYCGDYDDFELANENDELEKFLNVPKVVTNGNHNGAMNGGASRESSAEKVVETPNLTEPTPVEEPPAESTPEAVPEPEASKDEEMLEDIQPEERGDEEEDE